MGAKRDAYRAGVESALEAAAYGDFTTEELSDREHFESAILEICMNKRQYSGHPGYDFVGEEEWESFERGENAGAKNAGIQAARRRLGWKRGPKS